MDSEAQSKPRRGRPGYDQATVLRRAIEVFNRQGYDGTSMGDLARELGLTKSAIYHHVPSKEHLLRQALDEALDNLEGALSEIESATDEAPVERLRRALHGLTDQGRRAGQHDEHRAAAAVGDQLGRLLGRRLGEAAGV
jgi:AcrR family transcriptional regulator